MKKTILLIIMVLINNAHTKSNMGKKYFNGLYLGSCLGLISNTIKAHNYSVIQLPKMCNGGLACGVYGGFSKTFGVSYFAVEGDIGYDTSKLIISGDVLGANKALYYSRELELGVCGIIGILCKEGNIFYGKLRYGLCKEMLIVIKQNIPSVSFGFGYSYAFNNLILKFEYSYRKNLKGFKITIPGFISNFELPKVDGQKFIAGIAFIF